MSRPTNIQVTKTTNLTPNPQRYDAKVTNQGSALLGDHPSLASCVRGTFSHEGRFKDYYQNAYRISNPNVGPGAHEDVLNFRKQKQKPCTALIMP